MSARPNDPSVTLYAPVSSFDVSTSRHGSSVISYRVNYGYGLIYVKEGSLIFESRNFVTRGTEFSALLSCVTEVSALTDTMAGFGEFSLAQGGYPCFCCPCRGCPDGRVQAIVSHPGENDHRLYMLMPNSEDFADKLNRLIGAQPDAVTSQP